MSDILASVSVVLGAEISGFRAAMADARKELRGFVQFSEGLQDVGKSLTTFVSAPLLLVGGAAVKMAGDMEKAKASFTTMLGSAGAATATLQDLKQFAANTPFEFPEIQGAAKKLLAFNTPAAELKETLRELGDVSSGIDAPIGEIADLFGKARVQGRLFQEDINQLTGRGIPIIQELAKQFGVTEEGVRGLVTSGKVNFKNLQQAFADLTSEGGRFAGLMEAQSQTIPGLFSNLADNSGQALAALGQDIANTFNIKGILSGLASFVQNASQVFESLSPSTKGLIIGLAGIAAGVGPVLVAVGSLGAALPAITAGFEVLGVSSLAALGPILPVVAAVAAAAYLVIDNWGAVSAYFQSSEVTGLFNGLADAAKSAAAAIGEAFSTIGANVSGNLGEMVSAATIFRTIFREAAVGVTAVLDVLAGSLKAITGLLTLDTTKAVEGATQAFYGLIDPIANLFGFSKKSPTDSGIYVLTQQAKEFNAVGPEFAANLALLNGVKLDVVASQAAEAAKRIGLLADLEERLKAAKDAKPDLTTEADIAASNKLIASLEAQIKRLNELGIASKKAQDAFAKLRLELANLDKLDGLLGDTPTQIEVLERRISTLSSGLKNLVDAGVSTASRGFRALVTETVNLQQALDKLQSSSELNLKPVNVKSLIPQTIGDTLPQDVARLLGDYAKQAKPFELPVPVKLNMQAILGAPNFSQVLNKELISLGDNFQHVAANAALFGGSFDEAGAKADVLRGTIQSLISDGFSPQSEELKNLAAQLRDYSIESQNAQLVSQSLQDSAIGLGDALGNALGQVAFAGAGLGSVFTAVFASLIDALADFAEKKGKLLIALGIADLATPGLQATGAAELAGGIGLLVAAGIGRAGAAALTSSSGVGGTGGTGSINTTPSTRSSSFTPSVAPNATSAAPVTYTHYVEITASGRNLKGALALETDRFGRVVGVH